MSYPKYYRLDARCVCRMNETSGSEVQLPAAGERLPLSLSKLTFPDKERFDEHVRTMEETDQDLFDQYVKTFCGRVDMDINRPLLEASIQKQLSKQPGYRPTVAPPIAKPIIKP